MLGLANIIWGTCHFYVCYAGQISKLFITHFLPPSRKGDSGITIVLL